MSFKERMSTGISSAEFRLKAEASKRGIKSSQSEKIVLKWCIPDLHIVIGERVIAVFLDGEGVHEGKQSDKDDDIDFLLDRIHVTVMRYKYRPPLPHKQLMEIADEIEAKVKELQSLGEIG